MDPSGVSMKALERAVAVINRIITKSNVQKGNGAAIDGKIQGNWTKISAKARGQTAVQESRRPEKALSQYLALPVEEYSLLDPSWITREPDSNIFCLSAPVRGITGVELNPKVWVSVDVDAEKGTVSFRSSDRACTGDSTMDARLNLSFEGKLWRQPAKPKRGPGRLTLGNALKRAQEDTRASSSALSVTSEEDSQTRNASELTAVSSKAADGSTSSSATQQQPQLNLGARSSGSDSASRRHMPAGAETGFNSSPSREYPFATVAEDGLAPAATFESKESGSTSGSSTLHANAKVWASVKLGPPLNVVPGFLISYTGGLIATAVLQALMPSVLELLARDYGTWASGEHRAALLEPEADAASAAELVHS